MWKAKIVLCISLLGSMHAGAFEIRIQYPIEKETIDAAAIDSNFIFGRVKPVPSAFDINGTPVPVFDNGSFLAWLPIKHGDFVYTCRAVSGEDTTIVKRTVIYTPSVRAFAPDSVAIDLTSLIPNSVQELLPGEFLNIGFRGTPGCRASFSIHGVVSHVPLYEVDNTAPAYWGEAVLGEGDVRRPDPVAGVYRASYKIPLNTSPTKVPIQFQLVHTNGDTVQLQTDSLLIILDSGTPQIAETTLDLTILRTGPRKSYYYFLPDKVKLVVTGKSGTNYRIKLSDTEDAWIEDYKIRFLNESTIPHHYVRLVRTMDMGDKTRVTVYGENRLPYRIVQSTNPHQLKVFFYGVTADTDWIRYDFDDALIHDITWEQVENRVYAMTVTCEHNSPWGYDAGFDADNNFILDIKKTPPIKKCKRRSLKTLTILLDPGHTPDTGAIGPTGFAEKDANLLLAQVLAEQLHKKGATVRFTQTGWDGLSLVDRFLLAQQSGADILLSLHHNAVPAGVNPYKSRGTSTYYYHPQSRDLAFLIQRHLLRQLELPDFGLYWDNLAMCRPTQMPAILIEPAFMMFPEEEELVQSNRYRVRCSDAIVKALQEFVHTHRD